MRYNINVTIYIYLISISIHIYQTHSSKINKSMRALMIGNQFERDKLKFWERGKELVTK